MPLDICIKEFHHETKNQVSLQGSRIFIHSKFGKIGPIQKFEK